VAGSEHFPWVKAGGSWEPFEKPAPIKLVIMDVTVMNIFYENLHYEYY
jgi:hypothetical protein